MKIVICGATSHIASAIIPYFSGHDLTLFARNTELLRGLDAEISSDFSRLRSTKCDILINCIGAGTPNIVKNNPSLWFTTLEEFDNLALEAVKTSSPDALYIHFSSGAVFDRDGVFAANDESCKVIKPNRIEVKDYYSIAKLYAEAKHRSMSAYRILDLRIFSFFSRHIKLDSGYFMTDLVSSIIRKQPFLTGRNDIIRDFPAPSDLANIILAAAGKPINTACDVKSARKVSKMEIIERFSSEFGLQTEFAENTADSVNGNADVYFSESAALQNITGIAPQHTSIDTLINETRAILSIHGDLKS